MRLPRILHKWYADVNGYFWLPCPKCGRMFGGHETSWKTTTIRQGDRNMMTCPDHDSVVKEIPYTLKIVSVVDKKGNPE